LNGVCPHQALALARRNGTPGRSDRGAFHIGLIMAIALAVSAARAQSSGPGPHDGSPATGAGTESVVSGVSNTHRAAIRHSRFATDRTPRGEKIQSVEEDTSGHGAVLCAWRMYINLRVGLDLCFPNEYSELREDLDDAIAAMNRFIVDNRVPATSMDEVEAFAAAEDARQRSEAAAVAPDKLREACSAGELGQMINGISQIPRAERRKTVADLLSVPRQPVLNPCL